MELSRLRESEGEGRVQARSWLPSLPCLGQRHGSRSGVDALCNGWCASSSSKAHAPRGPSLSPCSSQPPSFRSPHNPCAGQGAAEPCLFLGGATLSWHETWPAAWALLQRAQPRPDSNWVPPDCASPMLSPCQCQCQCGIHGLHSRGHSSCPCPALGSRAGPPGTAAAIGRLSSQPGPASSHGGSQLNQFLGRLQRCRSQRLCSCAAPCATPGVSLCPLCPPHARGNTCPLV